MGDYSRDTFTLTNVLHQQLSGQPVAAPRHYVGVRLQQGVPLLDADWNELEDIRRKELELLLRDIIGDGVPGLGNGFRIGPVETDNDFAIHPGLLLAGGWQAINPILLRYSRQPRFFDQDGNPQGSDLTTPAASRIDFVYLDLFEIETGWTGGAGDERLMNPLIGDGTANRVERTWAVRVAEGAEDFAALGLNEPGHKYYPLARLFRTAQARIQGHMIEERRRLGLNLADGIKPPMLARRGPDIVDPQRYSAMLANLRSVLKFWQESELFPISIGASLPVYMAYSNALNEIFHISAAAEVASDTANLSNGDGNSVLQKLVAAQHALVNLIEANGIAGPGTAAFVDGYRIRLDGDPLLSVAGIQPLLDAGDLLGAVRGQEVLSEFLALATGDLPQGAVSCVLTSVVPGNTLGVGPLTLVYRVTSNLVHPATPEAIDLVPDISDVRWAASLAQSQISLAPGENQEVSMGLDPDDTLAAGSFADINLVASVHRRPQIRSTQPAERFTIGQLPPAAGFYFYSGPQPLTGGTLSIQRIEIEQTVYPLFLTLVNSSGGAQSHTFNLEWELIWPNVLPANLDPLGWTPNGPSSTEQVVAGAEIAFPLNLSAPSLAAVTETIQTTFRTTATLIQVDGIPVANGQSLTLDIPITIPSP